MSPLTDIAQKKGRKGQATTAWARIGTCLFVILGAGCVIDVTPLSPDGGTSGGGTPVPVVPGSWVPATGTLAKLSAGCGNMATLFAKPDEDLLIAMLASAGLWGSSDGGNNWNQLGLGSDASAPIDHVGTDIAYDPQDPKRYWESGIYGTAGVFETTDDGNTFVQLGKVYHCDSVSVDFTDPQRQTILAGGHEQSHTMYRSADGGMTWSDIYSGLPATSDCTQAYVVNAQTYLVGCGQYGGKPSGVYRTTDAGATWVLATGAGGARAPLVTSDGWIYWAGPNGSGMTRSQDGGQTWGDVVGPGIVDGVPPIELPDKRLATLGHDTGGRYVKVSRDGGATWQVVSPPLPYEDAWAVVYSRYHKAFYVYHATCGMGSFPIPPTVIMRFDFDYQQN